MEGTTLTHAIQEGDMKELRRVIDKGEDVNHSTDKVTPLMVAANYGFVEAAEWLVRKGADVHAHDAHGRTAISFATGNRMKTLLFEHGALIDADDESLFRYAITSQNEKLVREFVRKGAHAREIDVLSQKTWLWLAFYERAVSVMRILIEGGADMNKQNYEKYTILHVAVREKNWAIVKLLVEHGADINAGDCTGETPLMLAVRLRLRRGVELLVEGADLYAVDRNLKSAIHYAVENKDVSMVSYLIEKGVDVNSQKINEVSLMKMAINTHNLDLVQVLVEHGADVNLEDVNVYPPLYHAACADALTIAEYLVNKGANVNWKDPWGYAVLLVPLRMHNYPFFKFLVDKGANVNIEDNLGRTPLYHAFAYYCDCSTTRLLLEMGARVKTCHEPVLVQTAILRSDLPSLGLLVEIVAGINQKKIEGRSALSYAIDKGKVDCALYLVDHGADVDVVGDDQETILMRAVKVSSLPLVEKIVEAKTKLINAEDSKGNTALSYATDEDIAIFLLDQGARDTFGERDRFYDRVQNRLLHYYLGMVVAAQEKRNEQEGERPTKRQRTSQKKEVEEVVQRLPYMVRDTLDELRSFFEEAT